MRYARDREFERAARAILKIDDGYRALALQSALRRRERGGRRARRSARHHEADARAQRAPDRGQQGIHRKDLKLVVLPISTTGHTLGARSRVWAERAALAPDDDTYEDIGSIARENGVSSPQRYEFDAISETYSRQRCLRTFGELSGATAG